MEVGGMFGVVGAGRSGVAKVPATGPCLCQCCVRVYLFCDAATQVSLWIWLQFCSCLFFPLGMWIYFIELKNNILSVAKWQMRSAVNSRNMSWFITTFKQFSKAWKVYGLQNVFVYMKVLVCMLWYGIWAQIP